MEKSYFAKQREALVSEVGESLEQVLHEINKLNRSLESVIAVGNEFSSVEALWSQFESVMAQGKATAAAGGNAAGEESKGDDQERPTRS